MTTVLSGLLFFAGVSTGFAASDPLLGMVPAQGEDLAPLGYAEGDPRHLLALGPLVAGAHDVAVHLGPIGLFAPAGPVASPVDLAPPDVFHDVPPLEVSTPCERHPPIHIQGDVGPRGLILGHHPVTEEPIYRPGSGVVAGDGSEASPFRIEGWCLEVIRGRPPLVLEDTTAHVVVQDNWVRPGPESILFTTGGPGVTGIKLVAAENVTLSDNTITDIHGSGIIIEGGAHHRVLGNLMERVSGGIKAFSNQDSEFAHNEVAGRSLFSASFTGEALRGAWIHDNTFTGNGIGIWLEQGGDNAVEANHFSDTVHDLVLVEATEVRVIDNKMSAGIGLVGTSLQHHLHTITGNTIDGALIHYLRDVQDLIVPPGASQVLLANVTNVTVKDQVFSAPTMAIQAFGSQDLLIENNTFSSRGIAIRTSGVTTSTIQDNNAHSGFLAFFLEASRGNIVRQNHISGFFNGITLIYDAHDNEVHDNRIEDTLNNAIYTVLSERNDIHHNTIDTAGVGVLAGFAIFGYEFPANETTLMANDLSGTTYGIAVLTGHGQTVHDNNLNDPGSTGVFAYEVDGGLDARFDWWGCPGGPGADGCAEVEGDVTVVPWRTTPNPDAGRRP